MYKQLQISNINIYTTNIASYQQVKHPPRRSRGQKEHKMEWNIPSENAIITRLDELYEALDRFPDSPMAPAWQHEIERLKEQLAYAG